MTDIVKIDPKEFGLEEIKAQQIAEQFKPMLDKMVELEKEFNEVIQKPITKETCKEAKELRLKYVKVRTGTAEIHKQQKAFYLAGGRFVDGWKNAQLFASQGIEEKLEAIEKHYENLERQRIEELKQQRIALLAPYAVENVDALGLGIMSEDVWNNFLTGTKANHEAKLAAEKKAEEERIAREKAEAEEREKIRQENERLKSEAEERERILQAERENAEKERKALEEAQRKEREAAERILSEEKKKAESEAKRIREEQEAKLAAERAEREKLEAELKAKQEAEAKAKAEAEAAAEAELAKGDNDKMNDFIFELEKLTTKYQFKSKKHKDIYVGANQLIEKTVNWIKSKQ